MCNTAPTNMGALTPTGTFQNANANSGARRYWTFNAVAGCTYDFSSCNSTGTNDTYLRLYSGINPLTAVLQTSNDDNGPFCLTTKASLSWVCNTSGAYSILLTNFSCANISSNSILSYRVNCLPPYDPCSSIQNINCGVSYNLTVSSGNGVYNPPSTTCGFSTPGKEYIYSFTPTITGNYVISQPTSFGYIDWFYKPVSGGCSGTGWTCIDDISNSNLGNANVNISLTSGVTYYIMADPETTSGGNVTWSLSCPSPPVANDNCSGAISISSLPYNSPITSNNPSTTDVPTSTSGCGTQGYNLWYSLVGNGNQLTASTCNPSTNFDTELRVYTGSCAALNSMVEVACNDDDGACASGTTKSTTSWCSQVGVVYYISVGYFVNSTGYGNFILSVTNGPSCSPLPIELLYFEGYNSEGKFNKLKWSTATELNNNYFTIERSIDAINWSVVIQIPGAGNSSTQLNYEYIDYFYDKGKVNYYKLSQTDYNGVKEYFNVIYIKEEVDNSDCLDWEYYSLIGHKVDFNLSPPGVYLKKCKQKNITQRVVKYN